MLIDGHECTPWWTMVFARTVQLAVQKVFTKSGRGGAAVWITGRR
jgi:hypothetical protein